MTSFRAIGGGGGGELDSVKKTKSFTKKHEEWQKCRNEKKKLRVATTVQGVFSK